ncbi:uncharacterized protein FOMMEDRAFT_161362 [Fomitiporia mediterranea MF3/22]|uniref:uncharacterized protein n=1 Tax=Fomitiporia mediterranea (strain MF3/22) TaxID=694068 RepID=UPI00044096B2|nr:uncharacterized protein FOMMEDRAFT_161362 [Fomitiporia mediterranea MF3/22]EJC98548.1 hypothetical protein FOMMEDRAFT_161362 [Fomitiporia mediterranea MF3/22]
MDTDLFDTVPDADFNPNTAAQVIYCQSFTLNEPQTIDAYGDTNDTALEPIQVVLQYSGSIRTVPLVSFY